MTPEQLAAVRSQMIDATVAQVQRMTQLTDADPEAFAKAIEGVIAGAVKAVWLNRSKTLTRRRIARLVKAMTHDALKAILS